MPRGRLGDSVATLPASADPLSRAGRSRPSRSGWRCHHRCPDRPCCLPSPASRCPAGVGRGPARPGAGAPVVSCLTSFHAFNLARRPEYVRNMPDRHITRAGVQAARFAACPPVGSQEKDIYESWVGSTSNVSGVVPRGRSPGAPGHPMTRVRIGRTVAISSMKTSFNSPWNLSEPIACWM